MSMCVQGSIELISKAEVKKLCAGMRKEIDFKIKALENKIDNLSDAELKIIQRKLNNIALSLNNLNLQLDTHDRRIKAIEDNYPNEEFTAGDILDMYNDD